MSICGHKRPRRKRTMMLVEFVLYGFYKLIKKMFLTNQPDTTTFFPVYSGDLSFYYLPKTGNQVYVPGMENGVLCLRGRKGKRHK